VEQFKPPDFVDKPDDLEKKYFEEHVEHVSSFHAHHQTSSPRVIQKSFVLAMLYSLHDGYFGKYSNFHSYANYTKGYSDPETIRLAYMWVQFPSRWRESDVL
jgi:hypothetical protein